MLASGIATRVSWECVHFGSLLDGRAECELCRAQGLCAIQIDLTGIRGKRELLTQIAAAMNFPAQFGTNWDAMTDYLRDLSWLAPRGVLLVLENSKDLWAQPTLGGNLVELWLLCAGYWAESGIPFHLAFTWD